jgi:hypothetical protein
MQTRKIKLLKIDLILCLTCLVYLNCFNENKICNIFNPCNECMKKHSDPELQIKRGFFPFDESLEYNSGKILGANYGSTVFAFSSDGKVIFSLKTGKGKVGFQFFLPPAIYYSRYYAVSECGEVLVINEEGKIIKKAILDNDNLIMGPIFIKNDRLYIISWETLKIYDINSLKLIDKKIFEGEILYSDKIGFVVYSPPNFLILDDNFSEKLSLKARCNGFIGFSGDGEMIKELCPDGVRIINMKGEDKLFPFPSTLFQKSIYEYENESRVSLYPQRYGIFDGQIVFHADDGYIYFGYNRTDIKGNYCKVLPGKKVLIISCDETNNYIIKVEGSIKKLDIACWIFRGYSLNEYKYLVEDEGGNVYFIANCCDGDYVVKMKEDGNIIWMRKIAEWNCK